MKFLPRYNPRRWGPILSRVTNVTSGTNVQSAVRHSSPKVPRSATSCRQPRYRDPHRWRSPSRRRDEDVVPSRIEVGTLNEFARVSDVRNRTLIVVKAGLKQKLSNLVKTSFS